ncbi:MAG TPA: polyprenyl synthetase family protein [Thermoleophilaceae bacterium]|nr:polyprenyl synthetase family protein [Thermoleophilaceae bacterium]
MSGLAPAADVLAAGGPRLADLLERTETRLGETAAEHGETLAEHVRTTLAAGGKRLRPTLVYLAAGDAASDALVEAAVAVELLHMATLVHDDVLDASAMRRGKPTVFATGGRVAATATGDLLFSRAFAVLAATGSADAVRILSRASSALARGELMQREDAWSTSVTTERYLERCRLKTARLFQAACRLGAVLGAPGEAAADGLGEFGERIGVGFQILDDVLDVSGPPERTGKPRGTDLLDGTVTLPLILARDRDAGIAGIDLRAVVTDGAAAAALCDRIAATGALDDARTDALEHVAAGKRALDGLALSSEQRGLLDLAADSAVERYA